MKFFEFLKILRKFSRKFREKCRKISKYGLVRGSAVGSENIKKISPNINGNQQNSEDFHESLANFDWKRLILIKIRATLLDF